MSDGAVLAGKRIAMLVEDEFEDRELTGPLEMLRAAGATVTIVGPTAGARYTGKRGTPSSRRMSRPAPRAWPISTRS